MEEIKYENIEEIGIELLRKNNAKFYASKLSKIMERMFIAANKMYGITEIDNEYYMKSRALPDRVYYIYSDKLNEVAKNKIFDIVLFKDKPCIWFYSKNAIDMIGEDPGTILVIYEILLKVFKGYRSYNNSLDISLLHTENKIMHTVMTVRLAKFLQDMYGVIGVDDCRSDIKQLWKLYSEENVDKFIDHILENYDNKYYFTNKEYFDSYMILEM